MCINVPRIVPSFSFFPTAYMRTEVLVAWLRANTDTRLSIIEHIFSRSVVGFWCPLQPTTRPHGHSGPRAAACHHVDVQYSTVHVQYCPQLCVRQSSPDLDLDCPINFH